MLHFPPATHYEPLWFSTKQTFPSLLPHSATAGGEYTVNSIAANFSYCATFRCLFTSSLSFRAERQCLRVSAMNAGAEDVCVLPLLCHRVSQTIGIEGMIKGGKRSEARSRRGTHLSTMTTTMMPLPGSPSVLLSLRHPLFLSLLTSSFFHRLLNCRPAGMRTWLICAD